MKVFIPSLSGFCPGVKIAEKDIFKRKKDRPEEKVYILGHLIHNNNYIEFLNNNNIKTVHDLKDLQKKSSVIIRTHGMNRELQKEIEKDFEVLDLTCFKVKKVQEIIQQHSQEGYYIVITGKKEHPEMIGLLSYAQDYTVISNGSDLDKIKNKKEFLKSRPVFAEYEKVLILSQTTGNQDLFNQTLQTLEKVYGGEKEIKVMDTICSFTSRREQEALDIQKEVDLSFVVGDSISSNAQKIFQVLKEENEQTYFVKDLDMLKDLDLDLSKHSSVLVVSSSSTPGFVEDEIVSYLEKI